jgi:mono/diheme cytochrome c family protein
MNLTRGKGGIGGKLTDGEYVLAIRHGLAPNGYPLKLMPSSDYMNLSDEDLAAIIAYVKSLPPVDNELPPSSMGPLGRALMVAGKLPILHAERIDHERGHLATVPRATTAGYGAYLAAVGCKGCHGPALAGGKIADGDPAWPPAANLTPAGPTRSWSEGDFRRLLREGKRPDGSLINKAMPWRLTTRLSDDEIRAIWLYLRTLPPAQTPGLQTASR